jgi:hypothetical protein
MVKIIWRYWHRDFDVVLPLISLSGQHWRNVKDCLVNMLYEKFQILNKQLNNN